MLLFCYYAVRCITAEDLYFSGNCNLHTICSLSYHSTVQNTYGYFLGAETVMMMTTMMIFKISFKLRGCYCLRGVCILTHVKVCQQEGPACAVYLLIWLITEGYCNLS